MTTVSTSRNPPRTNCRTLRFMRPLVGFVIIEDAPILCPVKPCSV
jgi:hypothetical protein